MLKKILCISLKWCNDIVVYLSNLGLHKDNVVCGLNLSASRSAFFYCSDCSLWIDSNKMMMKIMLILLHCCFIVAYFAVSLMTLVA